MTDLIAELAEVVRLCEVATPGEWRHAPDCGKPMLINNLVFGGYGDHGQFVDAQLIVSAVNFLRAHHAELTQALAAHEALVNRMNAAESALRQAHKDYGFEIRDPNGTIWEACKRLQKENEQLRKERKCRHMFGADGDGSSCYLCGSPNPRHKY